MGHCVNTTNGRDGDSALHRLSFATMATRPCEASTGGAVPATITEVVLALKNAARCACKHCAEQNLASLWRLVQSEPDKPSLIHAHVHLVVLGKKTKKKKEKKHYNAQTHLFLNSLGFFMFKKKHWRVHSANSRTQERVQSAFVWLHDPGAPAQSLSPNTCVAADSPGHTHVASRVHDVVHMPDHSLQVCHYYGHARV